MPDNTPIQDPVAGPNSFSSPKPNRNVEDRIRTDLGMLLSAVGLSGVSHSELGGNHPGLMQTGLPSKKPTKNEQRRDPKRLDYIPPVDIPKCYRREVDIDPIERARSFQIMMSRGNKNVTEMAHELGRSRAYVRNHLRLLELPRVIQEHVIEGRLSEGHARAIAKMRDPEAMARLIIRRQLSVRDAEIMARRLRYVGPDGLMTRDTAIPNTVGVERLVANALGFKVRVKDRAGRGRITIDYKSPHEFQEIIHRLVRTYEGLGLEVRR